MWQLYDRLIEQIPDGPRVTGAESGLWTLVTTDLGTAGTAMFLKQGECPETALTRNAAGMPLRELARAVKSWNYREAALGMAAINAWYNTPQRAAALGWDPDGPEEDVFHHYLPQLKGKRVAVIGHFPHLETDIAPHCSQSILERDPRPGDYPDSACEYLLPRQDFVFITGSALVNKTMPRLLELSRIEAGAVMHQDTVELSALVREVWSRLALQLAQKRISLSLDLEEIQVVGDRERLKEAVENLASNALRHCEEGKTIQVSLTGEEGTACLQVYNDGPAIPDEDLPHLFEPFYRGDKSHSRDSGGTGLGLAIVWAVVSAHKGSCFAENREKGPCFQIFLPTTKGND